VARITFPEAQAWAEPTKLSMTDLDTDLLNQVEAQVLGRIGYAYPVDVLSWVDVASTPALVRNVIAMLYMSWYYDRQYSEDEGNLSDYARRLAAMAEMIIQGIIAGTIDLPEVPGTIGASGGPGFYPTDASTASEPTAADMSLGPEAFSMGTRF
jgi:hypothetical protein